MSWDSLNEFEMKEFDDFTNLFYILHVQLSEQTAKDPVLNKLRELIKSY